MSGKSTLTHGVFYYRYTKRILDIVIALSLLLIFTLPSLIIAFFIRISSPGPVFADVPKRIGQHGITFKMYKFRSMIQNAHALLTSDPRFKKLYEEYKKGSYKLMKDPRVTPIGKFIRKHSLDEIPQILNVLKGDMSIVGPRAYYPDELINQQQQYPHTQKLTDKVLSVKPGITGLWQVSGRSGINFDERIVIDAQYVDTISLWNDLEIIFKTPYIMLTGKGAV